MKLSNTNVHEFIKNLNGRKIICFGNSYAISGMLHMYREYDFGSYLKYIVDNNESLWGGKKWVRGIEFDIKSPREILSEKEDEIVIVITSERYWEILSQLDGMKKLKDTECYIFSLMQVFTSFAEKEFPSTNEVQKIPKVIHYCWFGGKPLSESANLCIESWRKYCPNYEIHQWDESNYDIKKNTYIHEAYNHGGYAFVSDFARLDILFHHGGIYMDTDVEVLKDLSPLLKNDAYTGFCLHAPRIATGLGMGAIKGFGLLMDMMDIYKYERYIMDYGFNKTVSQVYNTKALLCHGLVQNGHYQEIEGMAIYPKDYLDPESSHFGIVGDRSNAFSIHHSANTWVRKGVFKNKRMESRSRIQAILERIRMGGYPFQN